MKLKRILYIIALIIIILTCIYVFARTNNLKPKSTDKISIVCTSFVGYDFVKAITQGCNNLEITYLLDPGIDSHSFEPSASQLITIKQSKLFVYNGGEMENWTEQIIPTMDLSNTKLIRLMDTVELIKEKEVDGVTGDNDIHTIKEDHELSWDEHIWTSPKNAINILDSLEHILEEIDPEEKDILKNNTENYGKQIKELDDKIWNIVNNAKRKRLVFGDRMPIRYFLEEFGLKASGAFNGCSTETEPSAKTLTYLINIIKEENIPVVLYIENGNSKVANIIAEETGAKAIKMQTLHSISNEDYKNGETYVSLMNRNLDVLKQALQ